MEPGDKLRTVCANAGRLIVLSKPRVGWVSKTVKMGSKEFLNLFLNCAGRVLPAVWIMTILRVKVCVKLRVNWSLSRQILPSFFTRVSLFFGFLVPEKACVILCVICVSKKVEESGKKRHKSDTRAWKKPCKPIVYKAIKCPGMDSNHHILANAATWTQCVYQFRHLGSLPQNGFQVPAGQYPGGLQI